MARCKLCTSPYSTHYKKKANYRQIIISEYYIVDKSPLSTELLTSSSCFNYRPKWPLVKYWWFKLLAYLRPPIISSIKFTRKLGIVTLNFTFCETQQSKRPTFLSSFFTVSLINTISFNTRQLWWGLLTIVEERNLGPHCERLSLRVLVAIFLYSRVLHAIVVVHWRSIEGTH